MVILINGGLVFYQTDFRTLESTATFNADGEVPILLFVAYNFPYSLCSHTYNYNTLVN